MASNIRGSGFVTARSKGANWGVSRIELMFLLLAVSTGVFTGALYLGVDLNAAWELGLEKVGIASSSQQQPVTRDASMLGGRRQGTGSHSEEGAGSSPDAASIGADTLTYWNALREIPRQEQQRRVGQPGHDSGGPRGMLKERAATYRSAAASIRKLAPTGVDPDAAELARQMAQWYERGAELSDQSAMLDAADLKSPQSPLGRKWHSGERQQREEMDLLQRKLESLRGILSARYQLPFPTFR